MALPRREARLRGGCAVRRVGTYARSGWRLLFAGATAASAVAVMLLITGCHGSGRKQDAPSMSQRGSSAHRIQRICTPSSCCQGGGDLQLTAQQAGSSLTVFAAMNTLTSVTLLGHTIPTAPVTFCAARLVCTRHAANVPRNCTDEGLAAHHRQPA